QAVRSQLAVGVALGRRLQRRAVPDVLVAGWAFEGEGHATDEVRDGLLRPAALLDKHLRVVARWKRIVHVDPARVLRGPGPRDYCAHEGGYCIPVSYGLIRKESSYAGVEIGVWVLALFRVSHRVDLRCGLLDRRRCPAQITEPGLHGRWRRIYRGGNRRGAEA